jgi:adenylate cyclase
VDSGSDDKPPLDPSTLLTNGPGALARALMAAHQANRRQGLVRTIHSVRELLPGDENFGDELSTAGDRPSEVIARFLSEQQAGGQDDHPRIGITATSEAGLAALQVWQALSQRVGRGAGEVEATILFTDLVGFSKWVLKAGDELALALLRAVASVVEPAIVSHRGRVVKRLGDGHMAVFSDPGAGVAAALEMQAGLQEIEIGGHRPRLRAGLHRGQPRRLGGDYLGADVNIAARVGEAAGGGEVLVSAAVLAGIGESERAELEFKRRRGFRAKGAPRDLEVFTVRRG